MGVGERVYWAAMTRQGRGNVEMDDQINIPLFIDINRKFSSLARRSSGNHISLKRGQKGAPSMERLREYSAPGQIAVNLNRENNIFSNLNCSGDMSNTHTLCPWQVNNTNKR